MRFAFAVLCLLLIHLLPLIHRLPSAVGPSTRRLPSTPCSLLLLALSHLPDFAFRSSQSNFSHAPRLRCPMLAVRSPPPCHRPAHHGARARPANARTLRLDYFRKPSPVEKIFRGRFHFLRRKGPYLR